MSTETTQAFDDFLFHLPQITQNFIKQLHDEGYFIGYESDFIDSLEAYFLQKNISVHDDLYYDGACYLGEWFGHHYQGKWELEQDKKSVFYNKPIINYHHKNGVVFSPFTALKTVILKKKTGTLKTIIMSNVADRKPNP